MAPPRRLRSWGQAGERCSKTTLGRAQSTNDKTGQMHKPTNVFDYTSEISSIGQLDENEKDEEPYEAFDPPLHSTAIYADEEEFLGPSVPSTPQGKEAKKSSDTSNAEANENKSAKFSAKKPRRKLEPPLDESEGDTEVDVRSTQQEATPAAAAAAAEHPEEPPASVTPQKRGPLSAESCAEEETLTRESQPKIQKKEMSHGKRKRTRNKDSDASDYLHMWCLEGKKTSDIMELDVVLSAFETVFLEYKQKIESKILKDTINTFHSSIKEELIKRIKEVQLVKTLKRKNAKMISDIEKKRQRLIDVQDELLRLEPQMKQLQTKYDELKEKSTTLGNAASFLSNLKQLHRDYSDIQEKKPNVKETYDSSSLPALLCKARTLLGAENHLQSINHQLEKLLDQE